MPDSQIIFLGVMLYLTILTHEWRYELCGAILHWTKQCQCPNWKKCRSLSTSR